MPVVHCPNCDIRLTASADDPGRKIRCRRCKTVLVALFPEGADENTVGSSLICEDNEFDAMGSPFPSEDGPPARTVD